MDGKKHLEFLKTDLEKSSFDGNVIFDEPLDRHTYYGIGGPAAIFFVPKSIEDIKTFSKKWTGTKVPLFFLGQGSNVLASDAGFDGVVIKTGKMPTRIEFSNGNLYVSSSVLVSSLLRQASKQGWDGLEFLAGIPGSVGGVVAMNAGTHLGEAKDKILSVEAISLETGNEQEYFLEDLSFDYRSSFFLGSNSLVLGCTFKCELDSPKNVKEKIDNVLIRRKKTQPLEKSSCGSVFKNPYSHGMRSWEVIDELGLRGYQIGGAQISEKHPNFILNVQRARASDVKALIDLVKSKAKSEMNIEMHEEVKYLGDFD